MRGFSPFQRKVSGKTTIFHANVRIIPRGADRETTIYTLREILHDDLVNRRERESNLKKRARLCWYAFSVMLQTLKKKNVKDSDSEVKVCKVSSSTIVETEPSQSPTQLVVSPRINALNQISRRDSIISTRSSVISPTRSVRRRSAFSDASSSSSEGEKDWQKALVRRRTQMKKLRGMVRYNFVIGAPMRRNPLAAIETSFKRRFGAAATYISERLRLKNGVVVIEELAQGIEQLSIAIRNASAEKDGELSSSPTEGYLDENGEPFLL